RSPSRSSVTSPPGWRSTRSNYMAAWCCCSTSTSTPAASAAPPRYFQGPDAPDDDAGVMIGYPGMDKLVIGGRCVYRAQLHVHGTASHSGGSKPSPNAIDKAAHLVREIATTELPDGASDDFPLPGRVTVTAVQGGQGYSVTPDLCTLNIDIRTTPVFDDTAASALLNQVATCVDQRWPDTRPTLIQLTTRWPAYALPIDSPFRTTLLRVAHTFGVDVEAKIAGPSNIGNYLAGLGIPPPPGSASPTPACTPPTSASDSTPSPPPKPSTTPPCYPYSPMT
ncbi:MAG: peptidase dimerization domain-containing protein, partial [Pseudonocardiaceae bacterium]